MKFAGFWIRLSAHLIDFILWNALEYGLESGVTRVFQLSGVAEQVVAVIFSLVFVYGYYVEIPMRRGTTFGKQIFGIYVVDQKTGENFNRKQATVRAASYLLSYALIGCGFLMVLFHPHKLALHDVIAGTASIRKKKGAPSV
jgi:uncharacterized RDD family membrane protein YckC